VLARTAATALTHAFGAVEVVAGERLPSSERAVVIRAVAHDTDGQEHPIVLKAFTTAGEGFRREEAALGLAARRNLQGVVRLLAPGVPGPAVRTLAARPARDRHLRRDAVGHGDCAGPRTSTPGRRGLDAALEELRGIATDLDVTEAGSPGALVPGDTCPSNAVEAAGGVVLLDFEAAEYRHLAWEAAYLSVPWPTCWCSWALPTELTDQALQRWRRAVGPAAPVVTTPRFDDDLARALIGWVFISAGWFLAPALGDDPPPSDPARRALVPGRRALLQHRLRLVEQHPTRVLPALRELAARTHAGTVRAWGHHPLPMAAAFR
jgi:hypothetical protein